MVGRGKRHIRVFRSNSIVLLGTSAAIALISVFFFVDERKTQKQRLTSDTRAVASNVSARLETHLSHRINAAKLLGLHYVRSRTQNPASFRAEAIIVHELFGDFQALNWVDLEGIIRIVSPEIGNEAAQGLDLTSLPLPSVALSRAKQTGTPQFTAPLTLAQGGQGFVAYLPMTRDSAIEGYVNVVFRTVPLMQSVLKDAPSNAYRFEVLDGDAEVYVSGQVAAENAETVSSTVRYGSREWQVRVTPTPAGLSAAAARVDEIILGLGLLAALLTATLGTLIIRRQRTLRSRERENARLASAVEHLEISFSLWDEEDRLIFGNRVFRNLCHDIPDQTATGTRFEDFLRATVAAGHMSNLGESDEKFISQSLARRKDSDAGEFEVERSDGRVLRLYEQNLEAGGIATFAEDVTEQRRNEKSLRESEERLALAVRQLTIWDWDLISGKLYMSPGFGRQLGYTREEFEAIKAGSVADIIHPDDIDGYRAKLAMHLTDPTVVLSSEHRFRTKSGEYRWYLALGQGVVEDEGGNVVRSTGVLTDISQRVELENRLHQAQKMEAIGNLTGGVAHDFNNLLAVVLGNLELAEQVHPSDEVTELLNEAMKAVHKGAELTKNMLSFARRSRLQPQTINLNSLVREVRSWSSRALRETIDLQVLLPDDLWPVEVDPSLAQSALLNLILNSQDAMPRGGLLKIETENKHVESGLVDNQGELIKPGNYVLLRVTDTGDGIAPADVQMIFDPFFTRKPPGSGSGLGLSMVQGFLQQSGGSLRLLSEQGIGTSFELFFKARDTASEQPSEEALSGSESAPAQRARILVVEDDMAVLNILSKTLRMAGHEISTALSGDAALETLKTDCDFDLVITDIVMPGQMQGTDLARWLNENLPSLPVIFLSGYAEGKTLVNDGRPSTVRLTKPISKTELLKVIEATLFG